MNASVQPSREHIQSVLHEAIAEGSLEIPPPPQVASDILRITRGDGPDDELDHDDAEELSQLIQRDIALASQVMRVANSALYARRTPVTNLSQAIAWLGTREIRNIAFAVAVRGQVFTSAYYRDEMTDLWRESVITALFTQEVARLKKRDMESAYLCGLLHRVGMAAILSRFG